MEFVARLDTLLKELLRKKIRLFLDKWVGPTLVNTVPRCQVPIQ